MAKVIIDAKNAVLETVIGFKGSKALKDTFISSAKINKEDIIKLEVISDDPEEVQRGNEFFDEAYNKFTDKQGKLVEQLNLTIHKVEDKEDKSNFREFESPIMFTKDKSEVVFKNNVDATGKVRIIAYFGHAEDYDQDFVRFNTAIFDNIDDVEVHATNSVTDADFDF